MKELVNGLLKKNQQKNREYGLAIGWNHIPMVLMAMDKLGASEKLIQKYFDQRMRLKRGEKLSTDFQDVTTETWKNGLGKENNFLGYLSFFESELESLGLATLVQAYVPELMKGVSASAYHTLIRLGFAIDFEVKSEIVFALADWAGKYLPNPNVNFDLPALEPGQQLELLVSSTEKFDLDSSGNITDRIQSVFANGDFVTHLRPICVGNRHPLESTAECVRTAFAETQDFTLLHAVTSCQAMRSTLPFLPDDQVQICLTYYWHSICAAYIGIAKIHPSFAKSQLLPSELSWPEIYQAANKTLNQHTIKLAYTCKMEENCYGSPDYRSLAVRELTNPAIYV